jgi:PPK2 family polyphosphate:nucleotide phosphotransferase
MNALKKLIVEPGKAFRLADHDPADKLGLTDKAEAKRATAENATEIDRLQDVLFAEGKRMLLVVLQGLDTSGKDGTVRSVFGTAGPLGVQVRSFRQPTELERAHDYLWRVHQSCPPRGMIGIFNRSHYEDVLVVKVRGLAPAAEIEKRYAEINEFERMLDENHTRILKFMLNISKDEQKSRLEERLANPAKHWKFNPADLDDRKLWDDYMVAYETALTRCSTQWAPWHVIPADRNWVRNFAVSTIVLQALEAMDPKYPAPAVDLSKIKVE